MKGLSALAVGAALFAGTAVAQSDPDQAFVPGPPPAGQPSPAPDSEPGPARPPGPQPAPPGPEALLNDTWNTAACAFTDTAWFNLSTPTQVARIAVWYNWAPGEREVRYEVFAGGRRLGTGTMVRGSCDPYQGAWCEARAQVGAVFQPGRHQVTLERAQVCQNGASGGAGFIRVWGRPAGG